MMMSPLAVSTYFDSGDLNFDVVVFDEASQVRPHDAVCAIYRGSQLVVAGDQKQLPPTSFFERQTDILDEEPDEELDGLSDFESILDVCGTLRLPRKRLKWHYRSRRESLIAFSNEHFYDNELVTFPSVWDVDGGSAVKLEFVIGGRWQSKSSDGFNQKEAEGRWQSGSSGGFNQKEAERTADLVLEHMRNMPGASLGVITMNQRQQVLVVEEIEKRRLANPELEEFFSDIRLEPFFVKNLENVQGDERDVIFLSIGYARDQKGTMAMRFGPLNIQGGERRLNVAVTRARQSLTLITSIRAMDIDLSRTNAIGAKLLLRRRYSSYSRSLPCNLGSKSNI
jgi:superfamily I DNA and/or RNA helicase